MDTVEDQVGRECLTRHLKKGKVEWFQARIEVGLDSYPSDY